MPRRGKQFGQPRHQAGADLRNEGYLPGVLDVGQPDLSEQVFRALQLKGALPAHLDRDFQLGITSLDLTRPEYAYLRREALGYIGVNAGAVAGQFSFCALHGADDTLTVLQRLRVTNLNAGAITVQLGVMAAAPAAGADTHAVPNDARLGVAATLQTTARTGQSAAPGLPTRVELVAIPANTSLEITLDVVLASSAHWFAVIGQAVNLQQACSFEFRERVLLSSEL